MARREIAKIVGATTPGLARDEGRPARRKKKDKGIGTFLRAGRRKEETQKTHIEKRRWKRKREKRVTVETSRASDLE